MALLKIPKNKPNPNKLILTTVLSALDLMPEVQAYIHSKIASGEMTVGVFPTGLQFKHGFTEAWVLTQSGEMFDLVSGTLAAYRLKELKEGVMGALEQLQKGGLGEKEVYAVDPVNAKSALDLLKNIKIKNESVVSDPTSVLPAITQDAASALMTTSCPTYTKSMMLEHEPVPLKTAKALYQPVRGSSSGSRYFVVAIGHGIRVAARYKSKTLTVRVEGAEFNKHAASLCAFGFSNASVSSGYGSIHLKVDTDTMAAKALGSILLGLGIPFISPVPMLSVIKGMGS